MQNSKIEWTHHTFNGWRGCEHTTLPDGSSHPGCNHCYAEAMAPRNPTLLGTWGGLLPEVDQGGRRVRGADAYWRQPLAWNKAAEKAGERQRVFALSLGDVFEDWQGPIFNASGQQISRVEGACEIVMTMNDLRRELFALIDQTPWLDWLLLTKRPQNVRRMWPQKTSGDVFYEQKRHGTPTESHFYRRNVWLLTSISDQATANAMVPPLLECRDLVPVLGLSAEPLLGPIDLTNVEDEEFWLDCLSGVFSSWTKNAPGRTPEGTTGDHVIDWVVVGGESGHGARPMHPDWVRSIRNQCQAASVPFFFKQFGEWAPAPWKVERLEGETDEAYKERAEAIGATHAVSPAGHLHEPTHRPWSSYRVGCSPHAAIRRVGKKAAGRLFDGVLHDEFPKPEATVKA